MKKISILLISTMLLLMSCGDNIIHSKHTTLKPLIIIDVDKNNLYYGCEGFKNSCEYTAESGGDGGDYVDYQDFYHFIDDCGKYTIGDTIVIRINNINDCVTEL